MFGVGAGRPVEQDVRGVYGAGLVCGGGEGEVPLPVWQGLQLHTNTIPMYTRYDTYTKHILAFKSISIVFGINGWLEEKEAY